MTVGIATCTFFLRIHAPHSIVEILWSGDGQPSYMQFVWGALLAEHQTGPVQHVPFPNLNCR